ncbi:Six-hairpin glycosidase-like protein [Aspergillus desertorum]
MPPWTSTTPWLWLPESTPTFTSTQNTARIVLFRKQFTVPASIPPSTSLPIHISADTRYILFINGKRILFGPAKSYLHEYNYETIDVSPFLIPGEKNVIAAKVLRYSPVKEGNMGMVRAGIGGFILHDVSDLLGISTIEGSGWKCLPDDSVRILPSSKWNRALGPAFMQINEEVNGSLAEGGWLDGDYDDSAWLDAERSSMKTPMLPILEPWRLVPRSIPLFPEVEGRFSSIIKANSEPSELDLEESWRVLLPNGGSGVVEISPNTRTTVVVENESLITAFLELKFRGGADSTITIRCAECFEYPPPDGNPNPFARNKGNRADSSGILVGPEDSYTISCSSTADQEWTYEPFWFRTFRYIQLTVSTHSQPLRITSLTYRRTHYPLRITTALTNIPSIESKKWAISLNTLLNCMQETYTDCPFYEQNQFAFDSRLQMLYSYQLSSDDRLAKKTINEFHASRRGSDGLVETHFPTPFPGVNIPIFSLSWVLMVWDYVMYAVDTEASKGFVKRYLGGIDSVLSYFDSRISDTYTGMVGRFGDENSVNDDVWAFVDWTAEWSVLGPGGDFIHLAVPPAYRRTGVASYNSLFYAYVLNKAAEVCEFVGRLGLAEEYQTRAESVNEAVMRQCLRTDEDGQEILVDGPDSPSTERSQHVAVFAVLSGAVSGSRAKALLRRALHPDTRGGYVKASYAQSFYVLEAATQVGLYDELRDTLVQPWTEMVNPNLTTWAESAAMPRSDCHGWSCVPIHDVVANVVGLRPSASGYGRLRFRPRVWLWEGEGEGVFNVGIGVNGEGREVRVKWENEGRVRLTVGFDGEVEVPIANIKDGKAEGDEKGYQLKKMEKGESLVLTLHV